jgi:S1-C subfamily serine protease
MSIGNNPSRSRLLALAAATTTLAAAAFSVSLLRPSQPPQVINEHIIGTDGPSADPGAHEPEKLSLPELYERCSKSVVHLRLEVKTADELQATNLVSNGSGFVISPAGLGAVEAQSPMLILTNAHVVTDMSIKARLSVRFCDGTVTGGQVVCIDAASDLALVRPSFRSDAEESAARLKYPPLELARGIHRVGDRVFAIGSPFGLLNSLTAGIVSRLGIGGPELGSQSVSGSTFTDVRLRFLQTDLKLGPGNSGGPVIDDDGRVVGIATVRAEGLATGSSGTAMGCGPGIGFAIETTSIRSILRQMVAEGRVKRAWLGFRGVGLNHEIVEQIESISQQSGLETIRHGVLVLKVRADNATSARPLISFPCLDV